LSASTVRKSRLSIQREVAKLRAEVERLKKALTKLSGENHEPS
jgi:hypothetical protein